MVELTKLIKDALLEIEVLNEDLINSFLNASLMDTFPIGMYPNLRQYSMRLHAEANIGSDNRNIESCIEQKSLTQQRNELLEVAQRARDYILDNCSELTFTATFTDPSTLNKKTVIEFHEFENRGINVRKQWINRVAYGSGAVAAGLTTLLSYNQFIASQPLYNISQQSLAWLLIPMMFPASVPFFMKAFRNPRRVWKRERKILGKEKIVEDEIILGEEYNEFRHGKEGVYSGQFDKYTIYANRRKRLRLREWYESNKYQPLFKVVFRDNPCPFIWIVNLEAKIDDEKIPVKIVRAFEYKESEDHLKEPKSFVDKSYFREIKF